MSKVTAANAAVNANINANAGVEAKVLAQPSRWTHPLPRFSTLTLLPLLLLPLLIACKTVKRA